MQKLLFIFGTRPEAIKLAPVIKEFQKKQRFLVEICVTGQHEELLKQVLEFFDIHPNWDLNVMVENQSLFYLTSQILLQLDKILNQSKPDWVFVQGDTTTTFVAALAAYYRQIKVAHIEAGLRTHQKFSPFPEEINRTLVAVLADLHFAPTERARQNLLREGIKTEKIYVVGNTVIDALLWSIKKVRNLAASDFGNIFKEIDFSKQIILVTGHRRESFGEPFKKICLALREIVGLYKDIEIVFPVHLNPNVRKPVFDILGEHDRIHLVEPLSYPAFVWIMQKSSLIVTDSGGVQEEAPTLGKPVLVIREITERCEGVESGYAKIVGREKEDIVKALASLIESRQNIEVMINPYGDGHSAERISQIMEHLLYGAKTEK